MRAATIVQLCTAASAAWLAASPARAQIYVTSITDSFPDPNAKLPGFNLVPGAGITNWAMGVAQGLLTHGQSYNTCLSLASTATGGSAKVSFKLARGSATIQTATIVTAKQFKVGSNNVYYLCGGYRVLPDSPGAATLTGLVSFTATGATKPVTSKLSVPVLLQ